jgi:hypothetical protein
MKVQITLNLNGLIVPKYRDAWERFFGGKIKREQLMAELGMSREDLNASLAYMVLQAKNDDLDMYGSCQVL